MTPLNAIWRPTFPIRLTGPNEEWATKIIRNSDSIWNGDIDRKDFLDSIVVQTFIDGIREITGN